MSNAAVQHNLAELGQACRLYGELTGKTPEEVLLKQGGKLAFALNRRLRSITPGKGSIRAERLQALDAGEGIRVRKTARKYADAKTIGTAVNVQTFAPAALREKTRSGKLKSGGRNWWQIAVAREIAIREGGRAFLSVTARYPRTLRKQQVALSRFGPTLSAAGLTATANNETLQFEWDGSRNELQASAATGLSKNKGRASIALAIRDTIADINIYNQRKLDENLAKAFRRLL